MNSSALWWLFLNLASIAVLSFYSMMEMACVSFNKVRLQYYVSKENRRAIWLNFLLHHPTRLFGTTLIGVNIALFSGSEFSREFYSSMGLNPDLSPLTQIIIVVIFGELAPMFAARRYAEHVALLGVPIVYLSAKLMAPLLWILGGVSKIFNFLVGGRETDTNIFLSQDELQKILEEHDEEKPYASDTEEFNTISSNIFNLGTKDASQVMEPLDSAPKIPSHATVREMRSAIAKTDSEYLLVYHRDLKNIVGIAFPREFIRIADSKKVRDHARAPWFITQNTKVMQILKQFRNNNQSVAIILDNQGHGVGIIHLYDIMEEIFGTVTTLSRRPKTQLLIERTFPGSMKVGDFNAQFGVTLSEKTDLTLSDLLTLELERHPEVGDSIFLDPFEITVKEVTILGVKTVSINTLLK